MVYYVISYTVGPTLMFMGFTKSEYILNTLLNIDGYNEYYVEKYDLPNLTELFMEVQQNLCVDRVMTDDYTEVDFEVDFEIRVYHSDTNPNVYILGCINEIEYILSETNVLEEVIDDLRMKVFNLRHCRDLIKSSELLDLIRYLYYRLYYVEDSMYEFEIYTNTPSTIDVIYVLSAKGYLHTIKN